MSTLRPSTYPRTSLGTWTSLVAAPLMLLLCAAACSDDGTAATPDAAPSDASQISIGRIVFVNPNPTAFTAGMGSDSVTNITGMVTGDPTTTGLPASAAAIWPEVLTCFRAMVAPYDIVVVDEDPGAVDHIEIAISNAFSDIGGDSPYVTSLAPTTCDPLPRGLAFLFAGAFDDSVQDNCNALGWLLAHTVGLDTAFHCPDVTTFLTGCGAKTFTDSDVECGEFEVIPCRCGGATQNSHQRMLEVYGAHP